MNFGKHVKTGRLPVGYFQCFGCLFRDELLSCKLADGVVNFCRMFLRQVSRLSFLELGVAVLSLRLSDIGVNVLDNDGAPFVCFANQDVVPLL